MKGRNRHLLVDTTGLVLKVLVHPADVTARIGGQWLLEAIPDLAQRFPRLQQLWVDSAYQGSFVDWVEHSLGWHVEVVRRPRRWVWVRADQEPPTLVGGFHVLPRRWVVESTQPHYPPCSLDVQYPACHDRAHRAA